MFIEVTSTDRHKGDIVLSTLCAMYSAHCSAPYEVEPVEVTDALGTTRGEHQSLCPCVCWSPGPDCPRWAQAVLLQAQSGFCWLHGSRASLLCAQEALQRSAVAAVDQLICIRITSVHPSLQWAEQTTCAVTPDISIRSMEVDVAMVNRYLGVQLSASSIADLVSRMALAAVPSSGGSHVTVHIPPTRSDVLHPCDVIEVDPSPAVLSARADVSSDHAWHMPRTLKGWLSTSALPFVRLLLHPFRSGAWPWHFLGPCS